MEESHLRYLGTSYCLQWQLGLDTLKHVFELLTAIWVLSCQGTKSSSLIFPVLKKHWVKGTDWIVMSYQSTHLCNKIWKCCHPQYNYISQPLITPGEWNELRSRKENQLGSGSWGSGLRPTELKWHSLCTLFVMRVYMQVVTCCGANWTWNVSYYENPVCARAPV